MISLFRIIQGFEIDSIDAQYDRVYRKLGFFDYPCMPLYMPKLCWGYILRG